ncbi:hypothetical protein ACFSTE_11085 [Aquimarina hainanensis]|uniref:3-oxoacyl-[acyl-carrier-protein] synthase-3 n=1 Tax=Aquimarina hainanensis TaxID=1578017 RepID=A0ABW5NB10_9FLAO
MKNISIKVATFFPEATKTFAELTSASEYKDSKILANGIRSVHTCDEGISSTALSVKAFEKLVERENIDADSIDCVAWISEGVDDYIYMDTAKTFVEDIKGIVDGEIHTYQLYGGAGGTIQTIQLISNQIIANPSINKAIIVTSLIWGAHSENRLLYPTYVGDGTGVIVLEKDTVPDMIQGIKVRTLEAYNTPYAIPYGGTKHPITQEVIQQNAFKVETITKEHQNGILDTIIQEASLMINELCEENKFDIHTLDYIGISGFHQDYTVELLKMLPAKKLINPLSEKGYLGSLGVFEILHQFLNTSKIREGSKMLVINLGLEGNLEGMLIHKPISL